jgi:putative tricarboxylic transport membrane protein
VPKAEIVRFTSANRRDVIAGLVLLLGALVWVVLVYRTIEPSQGPEPGARAFPLIFGIALAALSVLMLAQALMSAGNGADDEPAPAIGVEAWAVGATIVLTILYAAVIEQLGFIVATALFVAAFMAVLLRIRRPAFILVMSVAMSLGSYVLFGKLLGTYLPPGTWITIQF